MNLYHKLRRLSKQQEKRIAAEMQGKTTPASGALRDFRHKGDVTCKHFRIEAKMTQKESYSLKLDILRKIENEALINCQCPLMQIDIQDQRFAVMRWEDFKAMAFDARYL